MCDIEPLEPFEIGRNHIQEDIAIHHEARHGISLSHGSWP